MRSSVWSVLVLVLLWSTGTLMAQQPTPANPGQRQAQASAQAQGGAQAQASAGNHAQARAGMGSQVQAAPQSQMRAQVRIQAGSSTAYSAPPTPVWLIRKGLLGWGYRARPGWLHSSLRGQATQQSMSVQQSIAVPPPVKLRMPQPTIRWRPEVEWNY